MKTKPSKIFYAPVALVFTLTIATSPATAEEVRLYRHRDFRGEYQVISTGAATGNINQQLIDQVSSLRVPQGFTVKLTDTKSDKSRTFDSDTPYVGDSMNDQADTYEIIPECPPGVRIC